jgi:pimeloyl-ACP methyl ester carboxylesterase
MPPAGPLAIPYYAQVVEQFCDRLGLGPIELVGHSMGGYIAADLAWRRPDRVVNLVLVSPAGLSGHDMSWIEARAFLGAWRLLQSLPHGRLRRLLQRPRMRQAVAGWTVRYPALMSVDLLAATLVAGCGRPAFGPMTRAGLEYSFRERLGAVTAPTLVVWGRKDSILPAQDAQRFVELIDDTSVVLMDNTGHAPMLERPVAFNDLLLEFIGEK